MKLNKIRPLLSVFLILILIFSITSCNKSDSKKSTEELKIGVEGMTGNFNPFYATENADKSIINQIYLSIQNRNSNNKLENSAGSISYEYVGDTKVKYIVTINKDLYFSDGTNVTIDDVIFWYYFISDATYDGPYQDFYFNDIEGLKEYYYDDKNYEKELAKLQGNQKLIQNYISSNYEDGADVKEISGIKRIDNYSCSVLFNSHNINAVSQINAYIVSKAFYSKDYVKGSTSKVKEFTASTLGCGPYYLVDYSENKAELLETNYNKTDAKFNKLTFIDLKADKKNIADSIVKGQVDIATFDANLSNVNNISKENLKSFYSSKNEYYSIFFNSTSISLDARKILMSVFNSYNVIEETYGSYFNRVYSPISIKFEESPNLSEPYYKTTIKTSLLSTYVTKPLNAYYNGTKEDMNYKILEKYSKDLAGYGVKLNISITNEKGLLTAIKSGKADLWIASTKDGNTCDKYEYFNTNGKYNYTGLSSTKVDDLTYSIRIATGFVDKEKLTKELMDAVMDMAVELPIYQLQQVTVYNLDTINEASLSIASSYDDYSYILKYIY